MDLRYMRNVFGIFNLLLCLIYVPAAVADFSFSGSNQSAYVNETFNITDKDSVPGQWVKLGPVAMNTVDSLALDNLTPCRISNLWCTGGGISIGHTGQASYIIYLTRTPVTVTDELGNEYKLTVAFPSDNIVVGVSEFNRMGGNSWDTRAVFNASLSTPNEVQDSTSTPVTRAQGWCGAISGCEYLMAAYPKTNSGMPYIYLKLPKNLSGHTLTFSNKSVLKMRMYISRKQAGTSFVTSEVFLILSGTITVPQRCYIRADNSNFNFGTVYSNSENGQQGQQTMTLTTNCYYASDNKQYLKMEAVSGGQLTGDNKIYQIAADSSSQKALGIVFSINGNADCNATSTGQNEFNKEYLINNITYQQHYSKTDKVNFALCKYGVPATADIGQKQIVLKLTSRWEATSS